LWNNSNDRQIFVQNLIWHLIEQGKITTKIETVRWYFQMNCWKWRGLILNNGYKGAEVSSNKVTCIYTPTWFTWKYMVDFFFANVMDRHFMVQCLQGKERENFSLSISKQKQIDF